MKTRWWWRISRASEDLWDRTSGFTTKELLQPGELAKNRFKFVAMRLLNGMSVETASTLVECNPKDLKAWERGKGDIPYDKAHALLQYSDFSRIRSLDPKSLITRFLGECSTSYMAEECVARALLRDVYGISGFALFGGLPVMYFLDLLGFEIAQAYVLMSLFIFVGLAFLNTFLRVQYPIFSDEPEMELAYAKRFIETRDKKGQPFIEKLLIRAATEIGRKKNQILGVRDLGGLYGNVSDQLRQGVIPQLRRGNLTVDQEMVLVTGLTQLSEHFSSPTLESAISLRGTLNEWKGGFPGVPDEVAVKPTLSRLSEWLSLAPRTKMGKMVNASTRILTIAGGLSWAIFVVTRVSAEVAVGLFAALCVMFAALWPKAE